MSAEQDFSPRPPPSQQQRGGLASEAAGQGARWTFLVRAALARRWFTWKMRASGAERDEAGASGVRRYPERAMNEVTRMLSAIQSGDPHAADELIPLVYDELRMLAAQLLNREPPGQTIQATALVHEAY